MSYPDHIIDAVAGARRCLAAPAEPEHPRGELCSGPRGCREAAVAQLDALVDATGGHHHLAEFDRVGFTLQHPLTERLAGGLFDCPVHAALTSIPRSPGVGSFVITLDGGHLTITPEGEPR